MKNRIIAFMMMLIMLLTSNTALVLAGELNNLEEVNLKNDVEEESNGKKEKEGYIKPEVDEFKISHILGEGEKEQGEYFNLKVKDLPITTRFKEIVEGFRTNNEKEEPYILKEIITGDDEKRYEFEKLDIILSDEKVISLSKANLDEALGQLLEKEPAIDNLNEVIKKIDDNKERVEMDLSKVKKMTFAYKTTYKNELKFKIGYESLIHNDIKKDSDYKTISFYSDEKLEEYKYIFSNDKKKATIKIGGKAIGIYPPNGYEYKEVKEEEEKTSEKTSIDEELNVEPLKENYFGKIKLKNKYNNYEESFNICYKDSKLNLKKGEQYLDVDDILEFQASNRIEANEKDKKIYQADKGEVKLKEDKSLNNLIKSIYGKDYQLVGDKNDLDIKSKTDKDEINFDYNRKGLTIKHQGSGEEKLEEVSLMPGTDFIYLKPQGEGGKIDGIEPDEDGYYRIELSKEAKDVVIKYDGEAPDIKMIEYGVRNKMISAEGKETNYGEARKGKMYSGSKFIVHPIVQHKFEDEDSIIINGYRFVDKYNKIILLDDEKVEILGYGKDLDSLRLPYSDDKVNLDTIQFKFIDKSSVFYRVTYRTAFGKSYKNDSGKYDLELKSEGAFEENIWKSKYYVVPKGERIKIKTLQSLLENNINLEKIGFKLIRSEDINEGNEENFNNPMKTVKNENGLDQVYLGDNYELEINEDKEFIYSYALKYEESETINDSKLKVKIKAPANGEDINYDFVFPRFDEEYEIYMPVPEIYSCWDIKGYELTEDINGFDEISIVDREGNDKGDKELVKGDFIKIIVSKDENYKIGDGDFFPKQDEERKPISLFRNKAMKSLVEEDEEGEIATLSFSYEKNTEDQCQPVANEKSEVTIYNRFLDSEANPEKFYTIETFKGTAIKIKSKNKYIYKMEDNKLQIYEKLDDPVSYITDKDNKKIQVKETDKLGNGTEEKDLEEDMYFIPDEEEKNFYINYKKINIDDFIPEIDIDENNIFLKKFYYIPYSYFTEDFYQDEEHGNIWKYDFFGHENENKPNGSCELMMPTMRHKDKYDYINNQINKYYDEIDTQEKSLVDFLREKGIPLNSYKSDEKLDINDDELSIKVNKTSSGSLKADDMHRQNKQKITEDAVASKKYTDTVYKSRRYSKIPVAISNKLLNNKDIEKYNHDFLNNPKDAKVDGDMEVAVKKGFEKDNEIPIIYMERINMCKDQKIEDITKPVDPEKPIEKGSSLKVEYYLKYKHENEMHKVLKQKELFAEFEFKNLPKYMIGSQIQWNINKIPDHHFVKDDDVKNENYDKEKQFIWSEPIEENKTTVIKINYCTEDEDIKPSIDKGKIVVNGFETINKDRLYRYEKEAPVGNIIKSQPYNLEDKGYYLLDKEDGNITLDYLSMSKDIKIEKDKAIYENYYYRKLKENEKDIQYIVKYVDSNEKEISKEKLVRGIFDSNKYIEEKAKSISGYKERLNKKFFDIDKDGSSLEFRKIIDDYAEQGYRLEGNKVMKDIKDNQGNVKDSIKTMELTNLDGKSVIKFYYDNIKTPPKPYMLKFIFDANGGKVLNKDIVNLEIEKGKMVDEIVPERSGYKFMGWTEVKDSDDLYNFNYPIYENTIVYAKWEKIEPIKFTFDANEGKIDKKDKLILDIESGEVVKENIATREGYEFMGWTIEKNGNELFDFKKPIYEDTIVYARWKDDKDKLDRVNHMEYIAGYPDNTIKANNNISREEVAAVFYRLLEKDYKASIYSEEYLFKDKVHKWSKRYVATLTKGGILSGYEDGTFKPRNNITRAEVATIASMFDDLPKGSHNFTDVKKGHWAEEYIGAASKEGWIVGYPDGTFRPDENITRAEFVTLVNKVLNRGVKKENILPGIKKFKDLKKGSWYYEEMVEAINGHIYEREGNINTGKEIWIKLKDFQDDMR